MLIKKWYDISLETVQNMYESSDRRGVAVQKAKGGPTPLTYLLYGAEH
jgi:hypothetical protein